MDQVNLLGSLPQTFNVKFRYRGEDVPVQVISISEQEIRLKYPTLAKAVTPGQACVFYDGEECLGCGFIRDIYKNGEKIWYLS